MFRKVLVTAGVVATSAASLGLFSQTWSRLTPEQRRQATLDGPFKFGRRAVDNSSQSSVLSQLTPPTTPTRKGP